MVAVLSIFSTIHYHTYSKIKATVLEYLRNQESNSNSDQGRASTSNGSERRILRVEVHAHAMRASHSRR